jgi:hypothetical protein
MIHTILFTGHMIDKPDRSSPRFPPSKEGKAAQAIRDALQKVFVAAGGKEFRGIAAAACGGDILFHEACLHLPIPSEIWLGIPADAFLQTSVAFAGAVWITRYKNLLRQLPVRLLHPDATAGAPDSVWEEANQWMLDEALAGGGANMTLIALWDRKKGDGPGGTEHLVRVTEAHGAGVEIIDMLSL